MVAACALPALGTDEATAMKLNLQLTPQSVKDQSSSQLVLTVECSEKLTGLAITVVAPPGFKADPQSTSLAQCAGKMTQTGLIKAVDSDIRPSQAYVLHAQALVTGAGPNQNLVTDQALTFAYVTSQISLGLYFALGVLGILIGWGLKILIKVLAAVPAPTPAPEAAGVGPITAFVQKHYYLVDASVTLALGFFALVALTQGNRPPQTGAFWYSALAVGASLGLLANSDLLVKLKRG
jgi:hypothetical protein